MREGDMAWHLRSFAPKLPYCQAVCTSLSFATIARALRSRIRNFSFIALLAKILDRPNHGALTRPQVDIAM
jgi:hypothetical protein